jgi:hypothetical protein
MKVNYEEGTYDIEFHVGFGEGETLDAVPAVMIRKITGSLSACPRFV